MSAAGGLPELPTVATTHGARAEADREIDRTIGEAEFHWRLDHAPAGQLPRYEDTALRERLRDTLAQLFQATGGNDLRRVREAIDEAREELAGAQGAGAVLSAESPEAFVSELVRLVVSLASREPAKAPKKSKRGKLGSTTQWLPFFEPVNDADKKSA